MALVPFSAWHDYRRRHAIRVVGSRWPLGGEVIVWVEVKDGTQTRADETTQTISAYAVGKLVQEVRLHTAKDASRGGER